MCVGPFTVLHCLSIKLHSGSYKNDHDVGPFFRGGKVPFMTQRKRLVLLRASWADTNVLPALL